ncbi:lipoprotein [Rhodocyclus gracilis]|uniref:lipoprotein n=1 Tax=Rhodocyclus gracilis TaxID=2929842 RepID=UPI003BF8E3A1
MRRPVLRSVLHADSLRESRRTPAAAPLCLVCACIVLLTACGTRGPLTLPPKPGAASAALKAAAPATAGETTQRPPADAQTPANPSTTTEAPR